MTQQDLDFVRESVKKYIGRRVRFRANEGRQRFRTSEGIISEIHPNIFVIELINDNPNTRNRKMSFSYHDIITKDVKLQLLA